MHSAARVVGTGTQLDGALVIITGGLRRSFEKEGTYVHQVKLRQSGTKITLERQNLVDRDETEDGAEMGPVEPLKRSRPQDAPARILLFPNEPEGFGNPLIDNPAAQEPTSPSPQVLELTAMVDAMEVWS